MKEHGTAGTFLRMLALFLLCFFAAAAARANDDAYWVEAAREANYHPAKLLREMQGLLPQVEQGGDRKEELRTLRKMVMAGLLDLGSEIDLRTWIPRGLALARELGDKSSLCFFLGQTAFFAATDGERERASNVLDEAMSIARQHQLQRRLAWLHVIKAGTFAMDNRDGDASVEMAKAYNVFESLKDDWGMATALRRIAAGDIATYEQALSLIDPATYRVLASGLYLDIGIAYMEKGEFSNARVRLEQALAVMKLIEYRNMADAYAALGILAGKEGRHGEALANFDAALDNLKHRVNQRTQFELMLNRADALAWLGRSSEARASLATAKALTTGRHGSDVAAAYHERASAVLYKLGDFEKAYEESVALRETESRAAEERNAALTEELKVRFNVQLKDKENDSLRTQRMLMALAMGLALLLAAGGVVYLRKRAAHIRAEAQYNKALAEAQSKASQAKSTFLANMSHELRSPLNAMLGFTRILLRDARLPKYARDDMAIVLNSGEHLYALVNQVLDISKIETGHIVLKESDFDLYQLLDELDETFTLSATQKGLHLDVTADADVPQAIRTDALKLRQVLMNLLSNALKFTSEGSVTLAVSAIKGGEGECRLSFSVSDTGAGIAADELQALGKAFVQAEAGRAAREGTGLGLAISRSFVELMGGKLQLASAPGQGTIASFDIALVSALGLSARQEPARPVVSLVAGQPRYRILVADDRREGRLLLSRLLTPMGFEVREAANGAEAVQLCEEWEPHLVWMDIRMPVMDGLEAARRIRAGKNGEHVVIIALTASVFDEGRDDILAAGCNALLRKPFQEVELLDTMRIHLGLSYIYAQPEALPMEDISPCVAALPAELAGPLKQALRQLDAAAIDAAIDAIREHDADIADTLAQIADNFEYGRILLLFEQAKSDSVH